METTETMRKFELVVIVDATMTKEQKEAVLNEVVESIKKNGGKVNNSQIWFEKQRFTFNIRKKAEGTYFLIAFDADGSANSKVHADLRLNEKILRFSLLEAE